MYRYFNIIFNQCVNIKKMCAKPPVIEWIYFWDIFAAKTAQIKTCFMCTLNSVWHNNQCMYLWELVLYICIWVYLLFSTYFTSACIIHFISRIKVSCCFISCKYSFSAVTNYTNTCLFVYIQNEMHQARLFKWIWRPYALPIVFVRQSSTMYKEWMSQMILTCLM